MVVVSGFTPNYSDLLHLSYLKLPSKCLVCYATTGRNNYSGLLMAPRANFGAKINFFQTQHNGNKYAMSAARNHQQLRFDEDLSEEPFVLSLIKEAFWEVRSLMAFLVEQPSQLKYVEWPSFSNTLRTASLTLVLVALAHCGTIIG
ncbi:Protein translocase complex, SecE/Sec61-gamma subunit [Quillaja saponaria]|uniref:Protein translocase complex, SecE/Sec61-gamma subunit n=1 Tax=Quillaja saponaria TaxID=32244 RepID=A0AAD7QBU6_QUISA|nr:Protein translocase complex, SecE/Sec61-gamma subunit [Quillaja saponaria]